MFQRTPFKVLSGLAIVLAWSTYYLLTVGVGPSISLSVHEALGKTLAQETTRLVGPGGKVTVFVRDTDAYPQPATDAALRAFSKEAQRAGPASISVKPLQIDPLRALLVPPGDFAELIRRSAPGDVIVSLLGPPQLSEEQRLALGGIKPKIVAFCPGHQPGNEALRLLAEQQLIHTAVVEVPANELRSRLGTSPNASKYDILYRTVRDGDFSKLNSASGSKPL